MKEKKKGKEKKKQNNKKKNKINDTKVVLSGFFSSSLVSLEIK